MKHKFKNHRQSYHWSLIPIILFFIIIFNSCQHGKSNNETGKLIQVHARNNSDFVQNNVLVEIKRSDIPVSKIDVDFEDFVLFSEQQEIASQSENDRLYFIIDQIAPGEEVHYALKEGKPSFQYPKKTQAEISVKEGGYFENRKYIGGNFKNIKYLRVPNEHTDHSYYIRYEGPGWESDLVGYRFYLDWRNATDAFGKKTHDLVLQQVGLDGFDSYHEMQDWGVDVLKVGSSLGIGSLGMYVGDKAIRVDKTDSVTCEIIENGAVRSAIKTNYYGWKVDEGTYDVESILSIHAGSRLTRHNVNISGHPDNLCTGVGKDSNAKLFTDQGNGNRWGYLATYGLQSLNNDRLGLAVFFASKDYKGFTEDEYSHIVKLNVEGGQLEYYFLAAWEGEKDGITSETEFLKFVQEKAQGLSAPINIEVAVN